MQAVILGKSDFIRKTGELVPNAKSCQCYGATAMCSQALAHVLLYQFSNEVLLSPKYIDRAHAAHRTRTDTHACVRAVAYSRTREPL